MRRWRYLLMAVLLIAALAGCQPQQEEPVDQPTGPIQTTSEPVSPPPEVEETPVTDGYTTHEAYPGLFFRTEETASGERTVTAYRQSEGEMVQLCGYQSRADGYAYVLGPEGIMTDHPHGLYRLNSAIAAYESLLIEACMEQDPDWIPSDGFDGPYITTGTEGDFSADQSHILRYVTPEGNLCLVDTQARKASAVHVPNSEEGGFTVSEDRWSNGGNGWRLRAVVSRPGQDDALLVSENHYGQWRTTLHTVSVDMGGMQFASEHDTTLTCEGGVIRLNFNHQTAEAAVSDLPSDARLSFRLGEQYNIRYTDYMRYTLILPITVYDDSTGMAAAAFEFWGWFDEKEGIKQPQLLTMGIMKCVDSVPEEGMYLYTDALGQLVLQDGDTIGPVHYINDINERNPGYFDLSQAHIVHREIQSNMEGEPVYILLNTPGVIGDSYGDFWWVEESGGWELAPFNFDSPLANLPGELVTADTLPDDPEEYYKVAWAAPVGIYARNQGREILLVWENFWRPFDRVAHTDSLNLPRAKVYSYPAPHLGYLAVISQVADGTAVNVEELVLYDLRNMDSTTWTDTAYDWRTIAAQFNRNNTLDYDAETNSFTITYNGQQYSTGTLETDMAAHLGLEDGFTGVAIAGGESVRYRFNEDDTITIFMDTCVGTNGEGSFSDDRDDPFWQGSYHAASSGINGITLSWNISVVHGQFHVDPFSIGLVGLNYGEGPLKDLPEELVTADTMPSDPEKYYMVAQLPEQDIVLYARGNGSEALLVRGSLWRTFERRTHTDSMELPQVWFTEDWQSNTLYMVSQTHNEPDRYVEELTAYNVYSGDSAQWTEEVHSWQYRAEDFNRNNTVVYDADTNTFAMTYKGRTFYTRPVGDFPASAGLPDGFTGTALITGAYLDYELRKSEYGRVYVYATARTALGFNGEGSFDENGLWQSPDGYYSQSLGGIGITLTWSVGYQLDGFYYSDDTIDGGTEFPGLSTTDGSRSLWLDVARNRIDAGYRDYYVIREDGTLVMWGSPDGVLAGSHIGDNHTVDDPLVLMENAVFVSANGEGRVMIIDEDGILWGLGSAADPDAPNTPRRIMDDVAMVECGQYGTMILKRDGTLLYSGGALPILGEEEHYGVTYYRTMDGVIDMVYEGMDSGAAVMADGTMWAWEFPVEPVKQVADNVAGVFSYNWLVTTDGLLKAWGYDYESRTYSVGETILTDVVCAQRSFWGSYALRTDGTLWSVQSSGVTQAADQVAEVACGEREALMLKTDGTLWQISEEGAVTDISSVMK